MELLELPSLHFGTPFKLSHGLAHASLLQGDDVEILIITKDGIQTDRLALKID
jgi:hypothetical protein